MRVVIEKGSVGGTLESLKLTGISNNSYKEIDEYSANNIELFNEI